MDKKTLVRWLLDIMVMLCMVYTGWSFKQFKALNESDIKQQAAVESAQGAVGQLRNSVDSLTNVIADQNEKLEALVLLATFRTDPWSGRMMIGYHEYLMDALLKAGLDIHEPGMTTIRNIQSTHAGGLIPDGFLKP